MSEIQGPGPGAEELKALQAAEEAKADPSLDEVEPAAIEVTEGGSEKEEPFEKLAAQARHHAGAHRLTRFRFLEPAEPAPRLRHLRRERREPARDGGEDHVP